MIVIERTYQVPNPSGGGRITQTDRKVFDDNELEAVNKFINETSPIPGYEWTNVNYKYIKL